MKKLSIIMLTVASLLSAVSFASAGEFSADNEIGFKYPTDLVEFTYPETIEFEYPTNLDK